MKKYLLLILFTILLKLAYFLFAISVSTNSTITLVIQDENLISIFKNNDSFWYEKITNNGYPKITNPKNIGYSKGKVFIQSEWAFFPLYPSVIFITKQIFHTNFTNSAFIISLIFSAIFIMLFYWFLMYYYEKEKAFFITLLLLLYPFNYYFSMFYTESIYLSLVLTSFILIKENKVLLVPIILIPLTLVKANGITLLLPLFIYYFEENNIYVSRKINYKLIDKKVLIKLSLMLLSVLVPFIIYSLYQHKMTNDYFAFRTAQAGWYRQFMLPFLSFFRKGDFTTQFNSVYTILIIIFLIYSRKKLPLSLNVFIWVSILLPLFSGSVTSMPRFISVIFPFTMLLGSIIYRFKYKYFILSIFFSLQLYFFYFWLISSPFSY